MYESINAIVLWASNFIWSWIVIAALIIIGLTFTIKFRFHNLRRIGTAIRIATSSTGSTEKSIGGFQALSTSLASLIGTGNIAGIALAITLGGPGAIFWMWLIAAIGMSTSMAEHALGQIYKRKKSDLFVGGPCYYITIGLKNRKLGVAFATLLILAFGISLVTVQSNTIADAVNGAWGIPQYLTGAVIAVLAFISIAGGIRGVGSITAKLVPFMGLFYIVISSYIIFANASLIPSVFGLIFKSAFGFEQVVGGGAGYAVSAAILNGVRRGLFSNEAGLGSAPNISASADVKHPAAQSLLGMLGIFIVTFIICTATAFIVLTGGFFVPHGDLTGVNLVQESISAYVGPMGDDIIALIIFLVAFSSIIGNYAYAESNIRFLSDNDKWIKVLKFGVPSFAFIGSITGMLLLWNVADLLMALMTVINVYAIFRLRKIAITVIMDYINQLKSGVKDPSFNKNIVPELQADKDNVW